MRNKYDWPFLATDDQQKTIIYLINRIIDEISNSINEVDLSLSSGLTGQLIFLQQCQQQLPHLNKTSLQQTITDTLFTKAADYPFDFSLARGLSGLGWALDQLGFSNDEDANDDINDCLNAVLSQSEWQGEFEWLYGLCGIGIYGAGRSQYPSGQHIVEQVVKHLEQLATETSDGICWETRPDSAFHKPQHTNIDHQYNLSPAHGNAGVIAFLTNVLEQPALSQHPIRQRVATLLTLSCNWLVKQRLSDCPDGRFPGVAGTGIKARLGWCYGDITTALILLRAGRILDDDTLFNIGVDTALATTHRDEADGHVVDGALCHGSAGIFLIYQYIYQYAPLPEVLEAAQRWLTITLDKATKSDDLTGLNQPVTEQTQHLQAEFQKKRAALLTGYSGIGLALLAAMSNEAPSWGEMLALS